MLPNQSSRWRCCQEDEAQDAHKQCEYRQEKDVLRGGVGLLFCHFHPGSVLSREDGAKLRKSAATLRVIITQRVKGYMNHGRSEVCGSGKGGIARGGVSSCSGTQRDREKTLVRCGVVVRCDALWHMLRCSGVAMATRSDNQSWLWE